MSEPILHPQIIPAVLIPLTALSVALSALATFIAALFGVKLKAEGPKKLLEVLLTPKILTAAILSNLLVIALIKGYQYFHTLPQFEFYISFKQKRLAKISDYLYPNVLEQNSSSSLLKEDGVASTKIQIAVAKEQKIAMGSFRGAVVSGDRFFIGSDDGYLNEYSLNSLEPIRKFYIGTKVSPAPVIYKNKIYVGEGTHDTHHARVYQFDLKSGEFLGALQTKGHTEGQAIIGEHRGKTLLFAVAGSDGVIAADPESLKVVWHQIAGHTDAAVKVHGGLVFSGSGREKNDGGAWRAYATAYDFETGKINWQRELPASSWMQPAVFKEDVCFVFGEVYFKSNVGGFACYDQKTGASRSSYMHFNPVVATPIVLGDDLVISDFMGSVCRVAIETGKTKWCQTTPENSYSLANAAYDKSHHLLVYPSQKNGLYILDPKNGEILNRWSPSSSQSLWEETMAPIAISKAGWLLVDLKENLRLLNILQISENKTKK